MANGPPEEGAYQCFFNRDDLPSPMEGGTLCDFPLAQLSGFPDHEEHFPLYTGARLEDMVESIRRHGVQSPILVWKTAEGTYIIISGHNRVNASKIAGLTTIPAVIRTDLTQETAEDLFYEMNFRQRSLADKVTYTFLLNRFQLSRLNGWLNDDGEVFIIYTRRSLSSEMQVSYHKIIEAMKELSSAGLIWERRCGRGDANQIYLALVEHRETAGGSAPFVPPEHEAAGGEQPVPAGGSALETGPSGKGRTPPEPHEAQAPPASPRSAGSELLVPAQPEQRGTAAGLEVPGPNFLKSQSGTSRDSETELPEVDQRDSSYIDLNHTDGIHTEFSLSCPSGAGDRMDGLGPWWRNLSEQEQIAQILENCSLWVFDPETAKVFENAIERLFYTQEYRIGKAVLPQANVRSRLWDLDSTILQSVEGKLRQNQRNVKNSTAYTMAVIFNAICESQSDLLLDPYLNSIGGAPAGSEKGGENQCF